MRIKTKATAIALTVVMALSVFTGCPEPQPKPPVDVDTEFTAVERLAAGEYIVALTSDKVIEDIDTVLEGGTVTGLALENGSYEAGTYTVTLAMSGYDASDTVKATGDVTLTLTGTGSTTAFEASAYEIDSASAAFTGADASLTLMLTDVKGAFVGEEGNSALSFTINEGAITDIADADKGVVSFGTPASGMMKTDDRIAEGVKDAVDGYLATLEPETPETPELSVEDTADVNGLMKSAFGAFDTLETGTATFTADGFTGTAELTVNGEAWTLHLMADRTAGTEEKASEYDVEFTVTSDDVAEGKTITVWFDGVEYTADASEVGADVTVPAVPFEWDVTVRLAKHSRSGEDHENYKYVTVEQDGLNVAIKANVGDMTAYTSTDAGMAEAFGDTEWFAVLIGTGEDNLRAVSYGSNGNTPAPFTDADIADREEMLGADGSDPAIDEFVLWMNPENASRTITLRHDNAEDVTITITFEDTTPPEMSATDEAALWSYITGFGHDRTILDLNELMKGNSVNGVDSAEFDVTGDAITAVLSLDAYDYDGQNGEKTLTGDVTITLSGAEENGVFEAEGYSYSSDALTFDGGTAKVVSVIDGVSGAFASRAIGGIPLKLSVVMDGNNVAGILDEDLQVVKMVAPEAGTVTANGSQAKAVADVLGDLSGYADAVDGVSLADLQTFLPYAENPAHLRTWTRLSDEMNLRDEFHVNSYDYSNGVLTFDITFTDYAYNTNDPNDTVTGNAILSFSGEENEEGTGLVADRWTLSMDEVSVNGVEATGSIDELSGPIYLINATSGVAGTVTFDLVDGEYAETISGKAEWTALTQPKFGMKELSGSVTIGADKISGEIMNYGTSLI